MYIVDDIHRRYVSEALGGAVERSGPLGYELPVSHIQFEQRTNLVPLGDLKLGAFQQRALLFKVCSLQLQCCDDIIMSRIFQVLCDQVGVACFLERGEYGRHWNKVWLAPPTTDTPDSDNQRPVALVYLVDLMFDPGTLIPDSSPSADLYQHL